MKHMAVGILLCGLSENINHHGSSRTLKWLKCPKTVAEKQNFDQKVND